MTLTFPEWMGEDKVRVELKNSHRRFVLSRWVRGLSA